MNNWFVILEGPVTISNEWTRLYFLAFYLLGVHVCMNIAVSFIINSSVEDMDTKLTAAQKGDGDLDDFLNSDSDSEGEEVLFGQQHVILTATTITGLGVRVWRVSSETVDRPPSVRLLASPKQHKAAGGPFEREHRCAGRAGQSIPLFSPVLPPLPKGAPLAQWNCLGMRQGLRRHIDFPPPTVLGGMCPYGRRRKALGSMAGTLIWMPGAPGNRYL